MNIGNYLKGRGQDITALLGKGYEGIGDLYMKGADKLQSSIDPEQRPMQGGVTEDDRQRLLKMKALDDLQSEYPSYDLDQVKQITAGDVPEAYGTQDPKMDEYVKRQRFREAVNNMSLDELVGLLHGGRL